MANWTLPTLTSLYTDVLTFLKNRDADSAVMFNPTYATSLSNQVVGTIRWEPTNSRWEMWNGTSWVELDSQYEINVSQLGGQLPSYYLDWANITNKPSSTATADSLTTPRTISLTGDATGSVAFDGSQNVSITTTVADDSHNHIIGNVDGLQTALDLKVDETNPSLNGVVTGTALATQVEAETGTNNDQLMTPLRTAQRVTSLLASQAEAEAGTNNTKLMTPQRTAQAIAALTPTPVIGWQPYDGATGVFYDHSVDGTVATVETPAFEDGYDYMFLWEGISSSSTSVPRVAFYREIDASYTVDDALRGSTGISSNAYTGRFWFLTPPRIAGNSFRLEGYSTVVGGTSLELTGAVGFDDATVQKVDKLRFSMSVGNIDAGVMRMLRRPLNPGY